jgi:hypothetical protein
VDAYALLIQSTTSTQHQGGGYLPWYHKEARRQEKNGDTWSTHFCIIQKTFLNFNIFFLQSMEDE